MKAFFVKIFALFITTWCGLSLCAQTINDNWWLDSGIRHGGVNLIAAAKYLDSLDVRPVRPVITAIIDGGFDVTHPYFAGGRDRVVWETPWNFLGNAEGKCFDRSGTEAYRYFKKLYPKYKNVTAETVAREDSAEYAFYQLMLKEAHISSYLNYAQMKLANWEYMQKPGVRKEVGLDQNTWDSLYRHTAKEVELIQSRIASLETDDDPHHKIGNDPDDFDNLNYGNDNIKDDPFHGTMVTGLVVLMHQKFGAVPHIMPIRAIPDGDEYDRDVIAAIHHAVDNGAKVINMSFLKHYCPRRDKVDEALQYALDHDVLLVGAAGNMKWNNDSVPMYPRSVRTDGEHWPHLVCVGASDSLGNLAAVSCYGKSTVDIMAPGMYITSTKPGGKWDTQQGTSLSSPIVAGIAATIRSYFPDLTAVEMRDILLASCDTTASIHGLCISGGVLNARKALENAYERSHYGHGVFQRAESLMNDKMYSLIKNRHVKVEWPEVGDESKEKGEERKEKSSNGLRGSRGPRSDYRRKYSSDSLYYVSSWGHNLFLYRTSSENRQVAKDSVQLTDGGEHFHSFAVSGTSSFPDKHTDPYFQDAPIGTWVGDSHLYGLIREDKSKVQMMTVVDHLAQPSTKFVSYKFPTPGDSIVSTYEVYTLDADSVRMVGHDVHAYKDQMLEVPRFAGIFTTRDAMYFLRKSRYQDTIDLCRIDTLTQQMKVLIHEVCPPHLNEQLFTYRIINNGKEIIWWSERSGRGQYYLYDGEGKLKKVMTPPDMVAGRIHRIDTLKREIIFEGYGREKDAHPTWTYFYRVGFNGKGLVCLTPEKGHHEISFNEDRTMIYDQCSSVAQLPEHRIYDLNGKMLKFLGKADASELFKTGFRLPISMKAKSADGETDLYGVVYVPSWMQKEDRFPIISNPYPGPHTDLVPEAFTIDDNGNQTLAEMGFIVVNFSYRGSNPLRGRDFYTHGYGNLRDYAIDDDMAVIRQVADLIPQADTTRVGIYGHSGGGFMSAAAMLTHPEFYKVGIAVSGNHDNNIYSKWWGETFHGRGRIPTNIDIAKNLKGHLLLMHGDIDVNVHPAHSLRLARALMDAHYTFDLFMLPGIDHGVGGRYYDNVIRYYFLRHLSDRSFPDMDIVLHK